MQREKATKACCDTFGDPRLPIAEHGHSVNEVGPLWAPSPSLTSFPDPSLFVKKPVGYTADGPLHEELGSNGAGLPGTVSVSP